MGAPITCTQCGGILDENYVCPYCGTRYEKPKETPPTTYNVNIVNNYGGAVTSALPNPDSAPPAEHTNEVQPAPTPTSAPESEPAKEEKVDKFIKDNSAQLIFLLLVAIVGVCAGVWTHHDWMIVVGVISGALFAAFSKTIGGKK